jgi:hypothetical protein
MKSNICRLIDFLERVFTFNGASGGLAASAPMGKTAFDMILVIVEGERPQRTTGSQMNDKREIGRGGGSCNGLSLLLLFLATAVSLPSILKRHRETENTHPFRQRCWTFFEFLAWFILGKNSLAMKEVSRGMDDLRPEMLHLPPSAPTQLIVHLPQRFYLNNKFNANSKSSPLP